MEWTRSGKTLDPKKTIKQVSDCGQEEKRIRNSSKNGTETYEYEKTTYNNPLICILKHKIHIPNLSTPVFITKFLV